MIAFVLLLAFAALAAGTYRQSILLFGAAPRRAVRLRLLLAGYGLLALSLLLVLTGPDAARQLVEWFGLASLAALAVATGCWARGTRR